MAGNRVGRRSRFAEKYFDEFRSRFWERPSEIISLKAIYLYIDNLIAIYVNQNSRNAI